MLGLYTLGSTALAGNVSYNIIDGPVSYNLDLALSLTKFKVNGNLGMFISITIPSLSVDGVVYCPISAEFALTLPRFVVSGEFVSYGVISGNLDIPPLAVEGVIITGRVFSGSINLPPFIISGVFRSVPANDWSCTIQLPSFSVSGVIEDITDEDAYVLEYSDEDVCLQ